MHYAYPPRKVSKPTAWIDSSLTSRIPFRTYLVRILLLLAALALAAVLFLRRQSEDAYYEETPTGGPSVVIVTLTDTDNHNSAYLNLIRENREQYAALFGYETFIAKAVDYDTGEAPKSWAKLMAIRHAITKYPTCGHIWFLDQNALILNPKTSLEALLLDESRLSEIMLPETPVVPDSIIETFGHLPAEDTALLISQDRTGLVTDSMIIKNGEWAKFFLEQWLNPFYRSYNFEKAERHALVSPVSYQADEVVVTETDKCLTTGTCCSMAPDSTGQGSHCTARSAGAIFIRRQWRGRRKRSLCGFIRGLSEARRSELRPGTGEVLASMEQCPWSFGRMTGEESFSTHLQPHIHESDPQRPSSIKFSESGLGHISSKCQPERRPRLNDGSTDAFTRAQCST
ncbi:hypothetical protein CC79DRAFT_1331099 [Sarocladium strictum]